jgi:hypothetical protein
MPDFDYIPQCLSICLSIYLASYISITIYNLLTIYLPLALHYSNDSSVVNREMKAALKQKG